MKVVLFCGGLGMRLRRNEEDLPKPMVPIGYRPVLWHVMKYYAHYGHKDFILCLGYKADVIKKYFLEYEECLSNDFVLSKGGKNIQLLGSDIQDWNITFVDTGLHANVGMRLKAVEPYIGDDEAFLANYADGLTDLHLPSMLDHFYARNRTACFLSVKPTQTFHLVSATEDGHVQNIELLADTRMRINGGYFLFKRRVFDVLEEGEELVEEPFQRLIAARELITYRHDGFWACMDTLKDKQLLEDLFLHERAPWTVWEPRTRNGAFSLH
jgi:glucose-1-phosphate cytidylyltransferase